MIALPWIVFVVACGWMIWNGWSAKQVYLRRKAAETEKQRLVSLQQNLALRRQSTGQGESIDLAEAFGSSQTGQARTVSQGGHA